MINKKNKYDPYGFDKFTKAKEEYDTIMDRHYMRNNARKEIQDLNKIERQRKVDEFFKNHPRRCDNCGGTKGLKVYEITGLKFDDEKERILTCCLCLDCQKKLNELSEAYKKLTEA